MKTERERKLEAAMQFYARHKTWNAEPYEVAPAIIDAGRNAREALADEGSGGEPPDGWVACDCVGQFGPNPGCGRCGGDGTVYEGSGGGDGMVPPPHDSLRAALRDSSKKVADGKLADDTPPQQRDALEALEEVEVVLRSVAGHSDQPMMAQAANDALNRCSGIRCALAQSGEGPVPEGYQPLTRDEALLELWQAINHPWGKTTDDKVILQRLHESGIVLAAPEPDGEKNDA